MMNNYHFYEEEAKGKYSVIFKARKKRKLDFVAIKRMDKSRKNKIVNQQQILSELMHSNIIRFYESIETKNHIWAVTEYCPGGDLLKLIEQDKTLPEHIVRAFVLDILRGLQYCHSKGIVICDLKPASVLINEYGAAKIGDFGSARNLIDLTHSYKQSKKGTPSYMAPELFMSNGVYSMQSDLWALGCLMYELVQGNPPFVSTSYQQIANLALTGKTPIACDCSSDFNNLLELLLAKEPQHRLSWEKLVAHPWLGGELRSVEMPQQPHFVQYLRKKQESNSSKMLRASQELFKDSYENKTISAGDGRSEYIFQNEEGTGQQQFQQQNAEEGKLEVEEKQKVIKGSAFTKKKQKLQGNVEVKPKPAQKQASGMEDSSNVNLFLELISRKNLTPLPELVNHQSDSAVKPIIGNKDIEVIESFNFNKNNLGFAYIKPEALAEGIINGEMEDELQSILDGMVGQEKYNVMGYFQSIIQNSDVANYLFKENFIKFYMRLMKGYKQAALRAKMFEIMGFLVRHATVIDPAVIKQGIIGAFVEGATKDKSQKVRRKAMAALGELLFYGATQVDEGVAEWDISLSLIHTLQKILKNNQEDEIVRIYCCKSMENITAQAKDVGTKFAQVDTLMALVSCFVTSRNQGFRTSICSTLHHIVQLNGTLRETLLEKLGVPNMIEAVKSNELSSKSLQILLWVMISQFIKSRSSKISKAYLEDEALFRAILGKLERTTSPVAKGRIYLYINFYLEQEPKKCLILLENSSNAQAISNNKLFSILEKNFAGDDKQNKYQAQCLHYLLVWLVENYEDLVKLTVEDIKKTVQKIDGALESGQHKKAIGYCGIIWHMMNSSLFEDLFSTEVNIERLFSILSVLDSIPQKAYALSELEGSPANTLELIKSTYMQTLEKLTSRTSISEKLQDYYANKLLPFLVGRILKSEHQDIKFNCMKFFLYLISFYLNENYMYDSTILSSTSSKVSSLVLTYLLPEIDTLLRNTKSQAVSTMVFKLLVVLFDINISFVKKFQELNKLSSILDAGYFKHSINPNALTIISKCLSVEPAAANSTLDWLPKVFALSLRIFVGGLASGQELTLDGALQIFIELVRINGKNWRQEDLDAIWEKVVALQSHEDFIIREKAEGLVAAILEMGRYGSRGRWEVKEKRGADNYERYLQLSGKQKDPKVIQGISKAPTSRYN